MNALFQLGEFGANAVTQWVPSFGEKALAAEAAEPYLEGGEASMEAGEVPACECPECCFIAGTMVVMADGTTKPIEQIKIGDQVLSRSQSSDENGTLEAKPVIGCSITNALPTVTLTFASGQTVTCSPEHPFYVQGKGFVLAGALSSKDAICGDDGLTTHVVKVSRNSGTSKVYNFAVEGDHTYFVVEGGEHVWVHNGCGPDPIFEDPSLVAGKSLGDVKKMIVPFKVLGKKANC